MAPSGGNAIGAPGLMRSFFVKPFAPDRSYTTVEWVFYRVNGFKLSRGNSFRLEPSVKGKHNVANTTLESSDALPYAFAQTCLLQRLYRAR